MPSANILEAQKGSKFCAHSFIAAVTHGSHLFGFRLHDTCKNGKRWNTFVYCTWKVYSCCLEIYLWIHIFVLSGLLYPSANTYCRGWNDVIGNHAFVKYTFFTATLYTATQHGILRRQRTTSFFPGRYNYYNTSLTIRKFTGVSLSLLCAFYFSVFLIITFSFFCIIERKSVYRYEATLCTIDLYLWTVIFTGQTIYLFLNHLATALLFIEFFDQVPGITSLAMHRDSKLLHQLITDHTKLWEAIQRFNETFSLSSVLSYYFLLFTVSMIWIITIFVKVSRIMKNVYLLAAVASTVSFTIASFLLSRTSAALYDSFQEVRIVSSYTLQQDEKLRALNFMKRFSKIPIGLSLKFFIITKKFPIKMFSFTYSIISNLLPLRGVANHRPCVSHVGNVTSS